MQNIIIEPLKGIMIEGTGEVLLGQNKSGLYKLLGKPSIIQQDTRLFYDEFEMRIDIDEAQNIQFIEFITGPEPEKIKLSIYDVDPFETNVDVLLNILSAHNHGDVDDKEAPFCYTYLNTSVGVWREIEPEGGFVIDGQLYESQRFWTIGIGVADYYR